MDAERGGVVDGSDLSGMADASLMQITRLAQASGWLTSAVPQRLLTAGQMLLHRTLTLVQRRSRVQQIQEAEEFERFLLSKDARSFRAADPEAYGGWRMLSRLLLEAARRTDEAAVPAVIASYPQRAQDLMEALARAGGGLPRRVLVEQLALDEAQASHLLRDLERVHLIARHRVPGKREVAVELTQRGREALGGSPPAARWTAQMLELLTDVVEGRLHEAPELDRRIRDVCLPWPDVDRRLREVMRTLLDRLGPAPHARPVVTAHARPPIGRPLVLSGTPIDLHPEPEPQRASGV